METGGFGARELVAVAAAAVAMFFALLYFAPAASSGDTDPLPIRTGEAVTDTATPAAPTPEPTEKAAAPLADPGSWLISIYGGLQPANGVADSSAFYPSLNLAFAGSPSIALQDNNWSVTARTQQDAPAGRYRFTLELDGEFEIGVDGQRPDAGTDSTAPRQLTITFDHQGGPLDIQIVGRDRSGPFVLRWK